MAVPEGKVYTVGLDQCLDLNAKESAKTSRRPISGPTLLLTREAWKAIYAPLPSSTAVNASPVKEDRRREVNLGVVR